MWLSPYGCLQFSLALRIPSARVPMNKLVFLQYLFSLAIVEACRDEAVLGSYGEAVKIKWPNDIYVDLSEGERKKFEKIGGVLVNTGIVNKNSQIVIGKSGGRCLHGVGYLVDFRIVGCGLNVLCPPPMCSLLRLIPPEASLDLRMEKVAATIMKKLEPLLDRWIKDGGLFDSFTDLYLRRWIHSYAFPYPQLPEEPCSFVIKERDRRGDDCDPATASQDSGDNTRLRLIAYASSQSK